MIARTLAALLACVVLAGCAAPQCVRVPPRSIECDTDTDCYEKYGY